MAGLLRIDGVERSSIAGVVIAGFGIGGVIYTFMVAWLLANIGERRLMAAGGMTMGFCLACHRAAHAVADRVCEFHNHGFRILPAARLHPGLRHGVGAISTRFGDAPHIPCSSFSVRQLDPCVYGIGLNSIGVNAVLLVGALALAVTGWVCALQMRRQVPAT